VFKPKFSAREGIAIKRPALWDRGTMELVCFVKAKANSCCSGLVRPYVRHFFCACRGGKGAWPIKFHRPLVRAEKARRTGIAVTKGFLHGFATDAAQTASELP